MLAMLHHHVPQQLQAKAHLASRKKSRTGRGHLMYPVIGVEFAGDLPHLKVLCI